MWLHWEVWHDVNGPEQGVDSALVSAGMELVSLVAGTVLWFGFGVRPVLIAH